MNAEMSAALAAAASQALGILGETVTIDGVEKTARVQTLTHDETEIAGGQGEAGGFRLWITKATLATIPEKLAPIVARGVTLYVLSVEEREKLWVINAGDPAIE